MSRSARTRLAALSSFPMLVALVAMPLPGAAQDGWTVDAGLSIAKDLRHGGGPDLGAAGWEATVFAPPSLGWVWPGWGRGVWAWGASVAYQRFGRFEHPVVPDFHADRSALLVGVRLRRPAFLARAIYGELGLDVVVGMEDPSDSDVARDPGLGGYAGIGWRLPSGEGVRPYAEVGLQGIVVSGELTDVGGVYPMVKIGLSF